MRSPSEFKVNEYVQLVRSPKPIGLYAVLDPDQPTRVVTDEEWAWEDGDDRPSGVSNQANFVWQEFRCFRRDYPYRLGWQALETAEWDPKAFYDAIILSQAMTNRTKRFVTLMENPANWGANTADATVLNGGGGGWGTASGDESSPNFEAIKKSILKACQYINLATNSVVKMDDLRLLISPGLAIKIAASGEMNSFLKGSPYALDQLRGNKEGQNSNALWGLPPAYAGLPVIIEDASYVNQRPNSSGTPATPNINKLYVKNDTSAVIISRKGGLDGKYGNKSFSTVQGYFYKHELEIQAFDDEKNERIDCHVVEQFKEVLAATPAGFLITNV